MELELRHRDGALTLEGLPTEIMEFILSYLSYNQISIYRRVSHYFNTCGQRLLNQGFFRVQRFHAQCMKEIKKQLPHRESERRNHPLARHYAILSSIQTRLSLLNLTFTKYTEMSLCCFIPGKVIDEIFRVLRLVQGSGGQGGTGTLPSTLEMIQELNDLSVMAMEHFEERIAPGLTLSLNPALGFLGTGHPCGSGVGPMVKRSSDLEVLSQVGAGTSDKKGEATSTTATSVLGRVQKPYVHTAVGESLTEELKQLRSSNLSLRKTLGECKSKLTAQTKKLRDQEQQINDISQLVTEQGSRLSEQEGKLAEQKGELTEMNRKLLEQQQKFADLLEEMSRLRDAVSSRHGNDGELGFVNGSSPLAEKPAPPRGGPMTSAEKEMPAASRKRRHSHASLCEAEAVGKSICSGSMEGRKSGGKKRKGCRSGASRSETPESAVKPSSEMSSD